MASSEEGGWQRSRPSSAWRPTPPQPPQPPGGGDPCRGTLRHHRRDGQCCDKCCYDSLRPSCGGGGSRGALRPTPSARWASIAVQTLSDCFVRCYRGGSATTPAPSRQCFSMMSLLLTILMMAAVVGAEAKSDLPRYETAYACEGKTLKIECKDGEVIHLIRANYGRFSITICNDHGNTEWSVNCMSNKSLRVLHARCFQSQNCSILASTSLFGDPCPKTLKYLEAHYKCEAATTVSTTFRPSPPWLITSQPSVWRSTVPTSFGSVSGVGGSGVTSNTNSAEKTRSPSGVYHLTQPTFRPQITLPPNLRPGVIKEIKNDGHSPEVAKSPKSPTDAISPAITDNISGSIDQTFDETEKTVIDNDRPRLKNDGSKDGFTENPVKKDEKGFTVSGDGKNMDIVPPSVHEKEHTTSSERDSNKRHHHHNHHEISDTAVIPDQPIWRYCAPQTARGLHWNWTIVGEVAVQQCPGGATGLARWRCVSSAHRLSHLQQQRRFGSPNRESSVSQIRNPVILDAFAGETLNGRNSESNDPKSFPENLENFMLPDPLAFNTDLGILGIQNQNSFGQAVWISENPDLSECRSLWLNSIEMRVKEGESLLSISNELSQVTSQKTLYGGDMMTTTNIMKKLAQMTAQSIKTFPDTRQREAFVTDLLLGVVRTGSNLLDIFQHASWKDLSHQAQMQAATSLLIGLEENSFLLAGTVTREKTIPSQAKNIFLSVRILETRNVETEEFPTPKEREKWTASQDTIYLPRGALIDNSEGGLVKIVFVAFDRLEEILQPLPAPVITNTIHNPLDESVLSENPHSIRHQQLNSEKDRDNITRVINSKIISASLGKGRHIQLSQPVKLTLRHLQTENVTNPTCVFWDFTDNVWSTEGCRVEWTNSTHTGCQCTHLTNFALLMDIHSVPLSAANALALNIITFIGCGISVVTLLASVIVFQCVGGMKSDRITIHKNLCACLLVAELIFMFGIEWTTHRVVCGLIAALLHYFFLAAFAWMFLEGFQLYAMLVEVFEPERARTFWYYLFAYLVPLVIVGISGIVDPKSYGTAHHCWLRSDNYFHLAFIGPVALVLVANWLVLFLVIYMMCRHSDVSVKAKENNKLYKIRVWLRSSLVLMFLLGLTWTFGLLYLNQETTAMAYIFTIFNSLQGLFIFIFHCLQNEMFQRECGRLGGRYKWLSCCLWLAPNVPPAPATGSSSAPGSVPQQAAVSAASAKHTRQQRHNIDDQGLEDVSDRDHPTHCTLKPQQLDSSRSWNIATMARPSAPPLPSQIDNISAPHSLSMPSIHNNTHNPANNTQNAIPNGQFQQNQQHRVGTPIPNELQHDYPNNTEINRSRSPSCFSVKMPTTNMNGDQNSGWGVVQNPLSSSALSSTWKNTSSKHPQTMMGSLQHPDHARRVDSLRVYQRYDPEAARSHIQHPRHHNTNTNSHLAYSDMPHYFRGSNQEYRAREEPEYEEIDRNETLMSDMSDDNSGHGDRSIRHPDLSLQGGSYNLHGDNRPLISYSPGESHRFDHSPVALDHQIPHGRYSNRWDSLERHADRGNYNYNPHDVVNPRTLAAVLNRENNVVCYVEPHPATEVLYPGHGHVTHQRAMLPPYSDC